MIAETNAKTLLWTAAAHPRWSTPESVTKSLVVEQFGDGARMCV